VSAGCTFLTNTSRVNQAGRSGGFQFRMAEWPVYVFSGWLNASRGTHDAVLFLTLPPSAGRGRERPVVEGVEGRQP